MARTAIELTEKSRLAEARLASMTREEITKAFLAPMVDMMAAQIDAEIAAIMPDSHPQHSRGMLVPAVLI